MRRFALPLLALILPLAGCVQSDSKYPSLLPRPAESQGTAEPDRPVPVAAADPALDKRIAELSATLDSAQKAFAKAAQDAEARIAVARGLPEGSEPWLDAQVALGALDAVRGQTTDVVEALEALAIERGRTGMPPYPALSAAIARANALAADQAKRIKLLESALTSP
ncbi:hypothetical protein OF829_10615 [Sphingomonas sp. LB-2]|uniref:hypothetical protein n=1 Tax=Sphingomonas caeni TaxID=2984949 RepID=UPI0022310405|nr:hypothetical protein [Sphingomonas caeni]MCW3847694.1 hypothetical protein [Sphingomonas caeni]